MKSISFTVPGPPKGKGRPRFSKFGAYTPAATKKYEKYMQACFHEQCSEHIMIDEAMIVHIVAHFPIPKSYTKKKKTAIANGQLLPTKKPDIDNIVKCIDALNGIAWVDDSSIVRIIASKEYSHEPRLDIRIEWEITSER